MKHKVTNFHYIDFNTNNRVPTQIPIATLIVYPHRASLKNMPGHGGIRPMLCQLSYASGRFEYMIFQN